MGAEPYDPNSREFEVVKDFAEGCDCLQHRNILRLVATVEHLTTENERLRAISDDCRKTAKRSGNRRREMQRDKRIADERCAALAAERDALRAVVRRLHYAYVDLALCDWAHAEQQAIDRALDTGETS